MSLFSELKRRNVLRVAVLYLAASWVLMQVADVGSSLLGLPVTTARLVFLLLAIGFPLVLVFSWVYEITPEGLKREKDIDRDASVTAHTAKKLNVAVIALLVVAIVGMVANRYAPRDAAAPEVGTTVADLVTDVPEHSIAVLPFVNMSADADNEYFSDGLSEELLNLLARIPELRVAARTSAFTFKGSNADVTEIGAQLHVAHVLEGSVRRSGDQIRVTAQLISASDGYHLWSESWDRTMTDIFAIQDEIAAAVVEELKVSLLGELPKVRETDPEAYSLYLRSKAASNRSTRAGLEEAAALLAESLAIDPNYADAWDRLAAVQSNMVAHKFVPAEEGYPRATASAERVLNIDPDHAGALSTLGWIAMFWEWDMQKAFRLIDRSRRLEPGNASVLNAYAVMTDSFGRAESAASFLREALTRDPLSMSVLQNLAATYSNEDRFDDMAAVVEVMERIDPESASTRIMSGFLNLGLGNSEAALTAFSEVEGSLGTWGRARAYYSLGRDAESDEALRELERDGLQPVMVATVYASRGDTEKAFEWLEKGYEEHDGWMIGIRTHESLRPLYGDPRWQALLEKLGITDDDAKALGL